MTTPIIMIRFLQTFFMPRYEAWSEFGDQNPDLQIEADSIWHRRRSVTLMCHDHRAPPFPIH